MSKIYTIAFSGTIEIKADSKEEALYIADKKIGGVLYNLSVCDLSISHNLALDKLKITNEEDL